MALATPLLGRGLSSALRRLAPSSSSLIATTDGFSSSSSLSPSFSSAIVSQSSLTLAASRGVHTSALSSQAKGAAASKAAPAKPPSGSPPPSSSSSAAASSSSTANAPERVFDFKPVLAPHQTVYTHPSGPIKFSAASAPWTPSSVRPGLLMLKVGMVSDYDQWGQRRALTALKIDQQAVVVGHATVETRGYTAIAIGAGVAKHVNKPQRFHLKAQGLDPDVVLPDGSLKFPPPLEITEFRVTPDALVGLPVGTKLNALHFRPGQYVTVSGTTQGKGFQGGMKRHGFAGQGASHGNSVSHRVLGSTGCRQDPGRVFKGKKMPGQMGGTTATIQCLRVYKVDPTRDVIYVQGAVPGKAGSFLRVTDSSPKSKKPWSETFQPPFPTYALTKDDEELIRSWKEAREGGKLLGALSSPATTAAAAGAASSSSGPLGLGLPLGLKPYELVAEQSAVDPFAVPENDEAEEV